MAFTEGFTFRGKHITEFGAYYVPEAEQRGTIEGNWTATEETPDGFDGGVWYDTTVAKRVFTLPCYYEDQTKEQMYALLQWFDRRNEGELVFDDRPYAIYTARPTSVIRFEDYEGMSCQETLRHSGTFTIELTCYNPFARLIAAYAPTGGTGSADTDAAIAAMAEETAVLPEAQMPAAPTTSSTSFMMYNCGTEYAHTVINVAGEGDVTITNHTTGQVCAIVGQTNAATGNVNKWVELDSATGRCSLRGATQSVLDYSYHDYGYIVISPNANFAMGVEVTHTSGSTTITSDGAFYPYMAGMFVRIGGSWLKIASVTNASTAVLATAPSSSGTSVVNVVVMNEITVEKTGTLTKFEMTCTPRVR